MDDLDNRTGVYKRATILLCLCGAIAVYYMLNDKPSQQESSALIGTFTDKDFKTSDAEAKSKAITVSDNTLMASKRRYSPSEEYTGSTEQEAVDFLLSEVENNGEDLDEGLKVSDDLYNSAEENLPTVSDSSVQKIAKNIQSSAVSSLDKVMEDIAFEDKILEKEMLADVAPEKPQEMAMVKDISKSMDESIDSVFESAIEQSIVSDSSSCDLTGFGVRLSCESNWNVVPESSNARMLVLSEDPEVVVSWIRWEKKVRFLGQVNKVMLQNVGLYENGFRTERVQFSGYDAVLVKGFSKLTAGQVRDYYYLYEGDLIQTSFRVMPRDQWDSGKFIIENVKERLAGLK